MTASTSGPPAKITMIDYGASNIHSAHKAFEAVGARVNLTADPAAVRRAHKLVLPGVGAFGAGMKALREAGLDAAIAEAAGREIPLLGICLGMQFLFEASSEMGHHRGLGLISGSVRRFDGRDRSLKVPHIGWNQLEHDETNPLLHGVPRAAYVYFVHSFYCAPAAAGDIVARTDYGAPFASAVARGRVYGIQFHPEKSQQHGLQILRNFLLLE